MRQAFNLLSLYMFCWHRLEIILPVPLSQCCPLQTPVSWVVLDVPRRKGILVKRFRLAASNFD